MTENSTNILDDGNISSPSGTSSAAATPTSELGRSLSRTANLTSDSSSTGPQRQRKKKVVSEFDQKKEAFLDTATNALNQLNEYKAFGSSIAFQLEDMDRRQKIIAQKLISDIVFHGKLGNLTEHTIIQLNKSHPPHTNVPSVPHGEPNFQPSTHPFPGYNYGNQNYPFYQPFIPPQSSQYQAPNNTIAVNDSPANNCSQTVTTGSLNTNDSTVADKEEDIGQYLVFTKLK